MKKIFGLIIKIIPLTLIILAIAGFFLYRPWYERQWHKIKGVYHVYKGDKAYERSRMKDANISFEISRALKYYNKALQEYPEHYQARCNLANIYVMLEDYTSALEQYKTALKYKPDYLECRMDLGNFESDEMMQYDEAISEYEKIAKTEISKWKLWDVPFIYNNKDSTKANKMNAYYNMGLAYRGKTLFVPKDKLKYNQYLKDAVYAYNRAVEAYNKNFKSKKNRNNYDTLYNLALTHHLLGNKKEAGLNYCNAIKADPTKYEAHLNLGILLDGLKYHKEAIEEFNNAGSLIEDGDYETIIYLNDLLNDSYKKNAIMEENNKVKMYKSNTDKKEEINIIYKNGKAIIKEESESEFMKRIRKCESKKLFEGMP